MQDLVRWNRRRDELFDDVRGGKIEPDEAERIAASEGLEPLIPPADPAKFDPLKLDGWSIMMVLAWICWRSIDAVRDFYQPWRTATPFWFYSETTRLIDGQEVKTAGWALQMRDALSWVTLLLCERWQELNPGSGPPLRQTAVEARQALWRAAIEGKLTAVAFDHDLGRMVEIPAFEWHGLRAYDARNETELRYKHQDMKPRYSKVVVPPNQVMRVFKPITSTARQRLNNEDRLTKFLELLMTRWPGDPWSKNAVRNHVRAHFSIGAKKYNACWSNAVQKTGATAWSTPGPKRDRPIEIDP
jgi:hypothetical protein